MANIYKTQGKYEERSNCTINHSKSGPASTGKYDEALEMHAKSLEIRTSIFGGDSHLDVTASLGNIGNVLDDPGKPEEAE
jgi:hypothetical protein